MNIFDFLKDKNFNLIVEIGTHFGTETIQFKELFPNVEIICFEPDPRNIKVLEEKGINKIAKVYELAISDNDGESLFFLSSGNYGGNIEELRKNDWSASNSLKKPKEHLNIHTWVKFPTEILVKTMKLDSCKDLDNKTIDFIWADVQGAEDLVFSGGKETLKRTKYIYTEFSNIELYSGQPNLQKILNILGENWEISKIFTDDVLLHNKELI